MSADVQARALRNPRAFCGAFYPWPLVSDLTDGLDVTACYIVREKKKLETRQNKPYLKLVLGDSSGEIGANVWDDVERWDALCPPEGVVGVTGRVSLYQERLQLKVASLEPLDAQPEDYERLLPASPISREVLEKRLDAIVASVVDEGYRALLRRCLGRGSSLGAAYRMHPAAKRNHHAYLSGLLEHSLSVADACEALATHYREQGLEVDRDLLITGALLHDIGKIRELKPLPGAGYTTEGQLLGHIVLGIQMVEAEAGQVKNLPAERLLLLQHLIASHQGKPEWDSPKVPQVTEALILHYADDLDAKMNVVRTMLGVISPGEWTTYDRSMERSFFRPGPIEPASDVEDALVERPELMMDLFRS